MRKQIRFSLALMLVIMLLFTSSVAAVDVASLSGVPAKIDMSVDAKYIEKDAKGQEVYKVKYLTDASIPDSVIDTLTALHQSSEKLKKLTIECVLSDQIINSLENGQIKGSDFKFNGGASSVLQFSSGEKAADGIHLIFVLKNETITSWYTDTVDAVKKSLQGSMQIIGLLDRVSVKDISKTETKATVTLHYDSKDVIMAEGEAKPTVYKTEIGDDVTEIGNGWVIVETKVDEKAPETAVETTDTELISAVVTKGELEEVRKGKTLNIWVEIENVDEKDVDVKEKEEIEKTVDDGKIACYVDISLFKKFSDEATATQLHETKAPITLAITLPEELRADDREYFVVRYHEGTASVIDGVYNSKDGTVTFQSDRFSGYALGYKEKESTPDKFYNVTIRNATGGSVETVSSVAKSGAIVSLTVKADNGYVLDQLTVLTSKGVSLPIVRNVDGTYSFVMAGDSVVVSASFCGFKDNTSTEYFYQAVLWAVKNGITTGKSTIRFAPYDFVTRAEMVTFLWRAVGSPAPVSKTCSFTDVVPGTYYYNAVLWGIENGVVKGTSPTTFSPNKVVTRCQAVTFLARLAGVKDEARGYTNQFADVAASAYYYNAVTWAVEKGITNGKTATTFVPNASCKRGEAVTFLYRYALLNK